MNLVTLLLARTYDRIHCSNGSLLTMFLYILCQEEEDKDDGEAKEICTPTHWSKLDPKIMKVTYCLFIENNILFCFVLFSRPRKAKVIYFQTTGKIY